MLIATPAAEKIIHAIRDELKIDQPGNGILFVQDVDETYGLLNG